MENEGSGIREYEGLTFIFDIDGTLCPIKGKDERYEDVVPYKSMVERIQEYKAGGAKIVLFTSRNMNSYHGNIGLINAHTAKIVLNWLEKWEIPTDTSDEGKRILPDIAASIRGRMTEMKMLPGDVQGVGIGVPGAVNADGVVNQIGRAHV